MTEFTSPQEYPGTEPTISTSSVGKDTAEDFFAFPLSPAQERMWYADRRNPGNPAYNGAFRWMLEGPVDPALVERTFNEITRRHEALRTKFTVANGSPVQVVSPHLRLRVGIKDLRSLDPTPREAEMDRICAETACQPFDLETDDLIRVDLLRMEDKRWILMLTTHHLVTDGWSIGLIMEEFQKIYGSFAANSESSLIPLPIQYPDYALWIRERFSSAEFARQLSYWTNKLSGYERLEVPPDFPRPAEHTTNAAIVSTLLTRELTDALKEVSNRQGGTMFVTSLSACMALLRRYTGKQDIGVGSPLAGRNRTDVENLIGLFVNHIILRNSAAGDPTFLDFEKQVRETVWEAFGNQDIPFENVLKALKPSGDAVREPFFLINFICQREYGRASEFVFEFAGIRMSTMPSKSQGALYDLNFFMVEREAGWRLSIEYNTDLYAETTTQKMLSDFRETLEGIASDPSRRLSELVPSRERLAPTGTDLLVGAAIAGAAGEVAPTACSGLEVFVMPASVVQERFWLLSKFAPGNPAFHMPACVRLTGTLSVEALQGSVRALVERHEILRTTFEEIDGKLNQVIFSIRATTLDVTNLEKRDLATSQLTLDRAIKKEVERPFDLGKGPLFRVKLLRIDTEQHVLIVTLHHIIADGWSHNVFQQELWSFYEAFSHGSKPALPMLPIQYGDVSAWQREWLGSEQAREHLEFWTKDLAAPLGILDFPTDHPPSRRISPSGGLETFLIADELAARLKTQSQSESVTMFVMMMACFVMLLSRYAGQEDIIVGSPVANRRPETEALIGPFAGPVAIRVNLSGNPVLRDVLNRVREATLNGLSHAELPFEVLLDKLKVRSVHGRNPLFQFYLFYQMAFLKPRQLDRLAIAPLPTVGLGTPFEIQIGIIERAEGIRLQLEYNADLFEQATIQRILLDYRAILQAMLDNPGQHLSELKVSAQPTLKAVETVNHVPTLSPSLARNDIERKLTNLWEELLGVKPIGIHQSYFDLGGNSLLAVRLFSRIHKEFNLSLPLATLFEAQTIAKLSCALTDRTRSPDWNLLVPIQTAGSRPPFFCIHGGGGNVLIYRALSQHLGKDQPFYGVQSQGLDGKHPLLTRIEDMAELYVREIRRVQPHGPYFLGGYCMGGTIALEMAQRLTAEGEKVALLALFDTVNWAKVRRISFYDRLSYQVQRLVFHCLNFGLLDFKDKIEFIDEKLQILRSRSSVWRGMLSSRLGSKSETSLLAEIWETNDRAILEYVPAPYPQTITDFRPVKQYSQYLGTAMDWQDLARRHEIVTLPVYPAGMLVEPFVKNLAMALKGAIDNSL
jgi:non-ribosomal peptide synthetase component F/thioesterase domain-containing protein